MIEFGRESVTIEQASPRRRWKQPYAAVVAKGAFQPEAPPRATQSRASFTVGDTASFTDRYGVHHLGRVVRLNAKTASVTADGENWRVPYALLRTVVDV